MDLEDKGNEEYFQLNTGSYISEMPLMDNVGDLKARLLNLESVQVEGHCLNICAHDSEVLLIWLQHSLVRHRHHTSDMLVNVNVSSWLWVLADMLTTVVELCNYSNLQQENGEKVCEGVAYVYSEILLVKPKCFFIFSTGNREKMI